MVSAEGNSVVISPSQIKQFFPIEFICNGQGVVVFCNEETINITNDITGKHIEQYFTLDNDNEAGSLIREMKESNGSKFSLYSSSAHLTVEGWAERTEPDRHYHFRGRIVDKVLPAGKFTAFNNAASLELMDKIFKSTYNSSVCIFIANPAGLIEWGNQAFLKLIGFTLPEVIGKRLHSLIYGPESDMVSKRFVDDKIVDGEPFSFQNIGYSKDGRTFSFMATVHPLFGADGQIIGRFSNLHDIQFASGQKLEILKSQSELAHIIDQEGKRFWVFYPETKRTYVDDDFKEIIGYDKNDPFDTDTLFAQVHPDDAAYFVGEILPKATQQNPTFVFEHRMKNKDGLYRYYSCFIKAVSWNDSGEVTKMVGYTSDNNKRKEQELAMQRYIATITGLLDNLNDCIVLLNDELNVIFCNDKVREKLLASGIATGNGIHAANVIKTLAKEHDALFEQIKSSTASRSNIEKQLIDSPKGKNYEFSLSNITIDGQLQCELLVFKDVTELHQLHQDIMSQRDYYHNVLHSLPFDLVVINRNHQFVFVNKHGIKDDDRRKAIIGKTLEDYVNVAGKPMALAQERTERFKLVLKTREEQRCIEHFELPDGEEKFMLRIWHPIPDANGEVDYQIISGIDITEQVKNERYARKQERRVANLLEIINDGVIRFDVDGQIVLYNEAFTRIMGIPASRQEHLNFFEMLNAENRHELEAAVKELSATKNTQRGVFTHSPAKNSQKHIDYLFTYSVAGDGHYFLGRLSDVTEIKNKEHVFSKIIEREKELNAQKSLFIRITSHELRTPLAVILANAEILQIIDARADGGGGSMLTARAVARIVREVNLMSDLLEQLTIVGKIEDGAVALEFKEYDLGEVISELCRELFQPYKDGRNISLVLPKILPSIIMDKRLFRHALTNLINNAFKYSQGFQPPQLYVSLQEKAVLVSVSDKGIGIPKNDLKKIFNTFYRGSNIGNIQGTGVGLMIVDYVVKKHKWRLDVDSAVNEGSTFTIKINL